MAEIFWIVGDVAAGPVEVVLGADESVPVFALPEFARLLELFVDLAGGVTFERMDDCFERVICFEFEQDMHVVGHDDEAIELVAFVVEVVEGV